MSAVSVPSRLLRGVLLLVGFTLASCATPGAPAEATGAAEPSAVWTVGPTRLAAPTGTTGAATLRSVQTERRDGFDRTVFTFDGTTVPGVHVTPAARPEASCGSGEPVQIDGAAFLTVRLQPTRAHTDAGEPTVSNRNRTPGLPSVRSLAFACDFEADVTVVLGLTGAHAYRTSVQRNPSRLTVDVRHTP